MRRLLNAGRWRAWTGIASVSAGLLVALSACGRGADSGATSNPNAPGSPGVGNATTQATPQQPDSRAGGSAGFKGVAPPREASGGDVMTGTTGRGDSAPGSAAGQASRAVPTSSAAESRASMPAIAPEGSTNRTPGARY